MLRERFKSFFFSPLNLFYVRNNSKSLNNNKGTKLSLKIKENIKCGTLVVQQ